MGDSLDGQPPSDEGGGRRNRRAQVAVLSAAYDLLQTVGYQQMTFDKVAGQAEVSKATVYRWWPTKAQLAIEALREHCAVAPVAATGELWTDVRALVQYAISIITRTPFGLTFPQLIAELVDDPRAREALSAWLGPTRAGHQAMLYQAASQGHLPHDIDATLVLDIVAGTILWRLLVGVRPDDRLVNQLTALVVERTLPQVGPPYGHPL